MRKALSHCCWLGALSAAAAFGQLPGLVTGSVLDATGAPIVGARLYLSSALGNFLRQAAADGEGSFRLPELPPGSYALRVEAAGFQPRALGLQIGPDPVPSLRIELSVAPFASEVTVTASRAQVEEEAKSAHFAQVRDGAGFLERPGPTIAGLLENSPGVMVQQTTPGQASPFLRGLTGYQTLLLVDGIRFNTSVFRSGPNQYLSYIEPGQAQSIEVVLGPSSAAYGSDALGGSINVVTREARFNDRPGWRLRGEGRLLGASADASAGANAHMAAAGRRVFWMAGAGVRQHQDLRTGQGRDSRNVFGKMFGLTDAQMGDLLGGRLRQTGFGQRAGQSKLAVRLAGEQSVTFWYQRAELAGVRSYRDLLGGLGRLQALLDPQRLQFFYARYEKLGLGPLDSLSGVFSVNSQRDDSTRQGLRATDLITLDRNRVDSFGYTVQAAARAGSRQVLVFGADIFDERIQSTRSELDPRANASLQRRALYPDGSRYTTCGLFAQGSREYLGGRVRAAAGGRFSGAAFRAFEAKNRDLVGRSLGVSDTSQRFRDATFNASLGWQVQRWLGVSLLVGRGFRAPNLNDMGALGLTGLGFEIPAAEAARASALPGADAGEGALAAGGPLAGLGAEKLWNFEAGLRFETRRLYARVHGFDAELRDPIVRRTVLFPAERTPAALAGLPVTPVPPTAAQRAQGVLAVATAYDPRAVKAFVNQGGSRYLGLEAALRLALSTRWSLQSNYTFLAARELNPGRPVRRLPPQAGSAALRYAPSGRRPWIELGATVSGAQRRLNPGDVDDERIGASRRRRDIADFFQGGVAREYLTGGAEARFAPTGETLRAIQDRVLPLGALIHGVRVVDDNTRVPLFLLTPGWLAADLRGGIPLAEGLAATFGITNLLDRNYRVHGSGIDAPGRSVFLGLRWVF